jgi:hypothetical protein
MNDLDYCEMKDERKMKDEWFKMNLLQDEIFYGIVISHNNEMIP